MGPFACFDARPSGAAQHDVEFWTSEEPVIQSRPERGGVEGALSLPRTLAVIFWPWRTMVSCQSWPPPASTACKALTVHTGWPLTARMMSPGCRPSWAA